MLESINLTKKYGSKTAIDRVTLKLEPGHIYAMLGPNGSGKTTWMKTAAGLIRPTSGSMLFRGIPVGIDSRRHIAYMSTEPYFYSWMTVRDAGRYYSDFFTDFSSARYDELLKKMDLDHDLKITALSTGMMAKMKIAVTLSRDAEVWMLDEPFNGIDLLTRDMIRDTILESALPEKVLLLSSHLVEEMEAIADTAVFMKAGVLAEVRELDEMRLQDGISMADRYRALYACTEVNG